MKSTKIIALLLVVMMCTSVLASCFLFPKECDGHVDANNDGKCDKCSEPFDNGVVTYNTFTSVMPSNWNELTYQDNNDTQILSYISSSFFDYDYMFEGGKFNADGSINTDGIVPGAFTVNYSAATKLEDVTSTVDAKWGYTDEQKTEGGYAWKITLRNDLKWDDGTPITAADFEYSMKAQLDPKFMNYRGNTYYDTLRVKNSYEYFFSGAPIYEVAFDWETETANHEGPYFINVNAAWSGNSSYNIKWFYDEGYLTDKYQVEVDAEGKPVMGADGKPVYALDENGERIQIAFGATYYEELSKLANEYGYIPVEGNEDKFAEMFNQMLAAFGKTPLEAVEYYPTFYLYFTGEYGDEVDWATVGLYADEEDNAVVILLDKSYSLLNEDGSLAIWAAYYMSSLPLVHKAKYEANAHDPAEGASLKTSTYNSSLDSTASWGPYKLVEFEAGSYYKLAKNPYWYGWNMDTYKNQYNVDFVNCRKVEEFTTSWMGFLNGSYDDHGLSTENYDEYKDSKYITYSTSSGTFGMQLFSDLNVLKNSGNNNGILAIQEFRHAFNLALNRNDIVEKIYPGSTVPCFGLLNNMYFYDIENSTTLPDGGIYRNTEEAKKGILRAYGFTEVDGKWSNGTLNDLSLDDAYDSLTGYNMELAKVKMAEAIEILNADADHYGYDASKDITIIFGSSLDNDKQRFRCEFLQGVLNELTKGTSLEGKIKLVFDASAGDGWANAFRTGKTQIGFGYGFQGNPFNPFDIVGGFVDPSDSLNYHTYWDTTKVNMTLTLPVGENGADVEITMNLQNWYYCLNGLAEQKAQEFTYNFDAGKVDSSVRLTILAALEEIVLKESRSVMLIGDATGSLLSAKYSYINYDYNTFMGYGGIRYMTVNYTDFQWNEFVKSMNNDLSNFYKVSE